MTRPDPYEDAKHRRADEQEQQHPEGNVPQATDLPRQGVPVDDGEPATQPEGGQTGVDLLA